ncbi:MAG: T9SS type A sorting domain-containing protein [Bacteroidales bacterium]|nr:T9SS type A sorting domain-containing protein [Bacteroidales bacterium]
MKRKVLIAMVFMLAMLASIKTFAQTTDITAYCRAEVNCAYEFMQDVKKFYFEGEYIVFELGDGTTTSLQISAIKKMTLTYNAPDPTDVDEFAGGDGLYPNPVSDVLYFNFNVGADVVMQIYSATGQLVKEENLSSDGAVDVSNLSEGLYIVKIDGKTYKFSKL